MLLAVSVVAASAGAVHYYLRGLHTVFLPLTKQKIMGHSRRTPRAEPDDDVVRCINWTHALSPLLEKARKTSLDSMCTKICETGAFDKKFEFENGRLQELAEYFERHGDQAMSDASFRWQLIASQPYLSLLQRGEPVVDLVRHAPREQKLKADLDWSFEMLRTTADFVYEYARYRYIDEKRGHDLALLTELREQCSTAPAKKIERLCRATVATEQH